jgi:large subunit ribosomal protein L4
MVLKVYSIDGTELREIEVSDEIFGCDVSDGSIYFAIKNELANMRVGTACTKTRSEVSGTHQKMFRQKGTGRARMGTKRSPVRVGGGIAFGPKPRSYKYKLPRKIKQSAIRSIFSLKNNESCLRIIEDFNVESGKTKDLVSVLKNHVKETRTVLIIQDDNSMIKRAGSNVPWLTTFSYNRLRAHDLFYGRNLVVQESAIKKLNEFYAAK